MSIAADDDPSNASSAGQRAAEWWRSAVVYQVYPRSFADSDSDGTGDVGGIIDRLPYLAELGIDAVWVSPWYPSPLADGGYDVSDYRDIHPDFGNLELADRFIAKAHELGLRVLIDLVPNHSSDQHEWFQEALRASPGSPERDLYIFKDGGGPDRDRPPTNWISLFGGSAWERVVDAEGNPEQFFLHMFAPEQPDFNWDNERVAAEFDSILRFWFDRGVDGFRVDVADSMAKDPEFPDMRINEKTGVATLEKYVGSPIFDQPHVLDIHRRWRRVADEYAGTELGARVFVAEAYLTPPERLAKYVEGERLHTTFNFDYLLSEWSAASQREIINLTLRAHDAVGAPCTWVLSNHDTPRVATRYGKPRSGVRFADGGIVSQDQGRGWHDLLAQPTDIELGRRRARAAALLELALPGGAYVYQGDELGLDEVEDLPEEALQDPTWLRSNHTIRGRDGCRVPIPWSGGESPFGFGETAEPWLPMPSHWAHLTVEAQRADEHSHLNLYRSALAERRRNPALGDGDLAWDDTPAEVLSFSREPGFRCIVNFGAEDYPIPAGHTVLVFSGPVASGPVASSDASGPVASGGASGPVASGGASGPVASGGASATLVGTDQAVWLRF